LFENFSGSSLKHVIADRVNRLGEFLPIWRLFTLGEIFEHYKNSQYFWATFFAGNICVSILTKNGLSCILGYFFTNSSVHPGTRVARWFIFKPKIPIWVNFERL
jgi:hypothetical protein